METSTLSIARKQQKGFLQTRNQANPKDNQRFILSELTFANYFDFLNDEVINFVPMLYRALVQIYPEIADIETPSNQVNDILSSIIAFLETKFSLYDINFIEKGNRKFLHIYKELGLIDNQVFILTYKGIKPLKYKNRKLYNIALGVLKSLPFGDIRTLDYFSYMLEIFEYEKDNSELTKFEQKHLQKSFNSLCYFFEQLDNATTENWKELLENYNPKKQAYKDFKKLLCKAKNINFSLIYHLANGTFCFQQDEDVYSQHIFANNFLTLFDEDVFSENFILEYINTNANEFGTFPAVDQMVINDKGKIVLPFSIQEQDIQNIIDFIFEFNSFTF